MSLQDLLSGYSQDINARISHEQDHEQEIADRKANTVEEHFQHFKDAMESAGQELGTAGMAIHMGRKVWKKYQEKYKNKPGQSAAQDEPKANENPGAQADPEQKPVGDEPIEEGAETKTPAAPEGAESGDTIDTTQKDLDTIKTQPADDIEPLEFEKGPVRIVSSEEIQPQGDLGRNIQTAEEYGSSGPADAPKAPEEPEAPSATEAPKAPGAEELGDAPEIQASEGLTGDSGSLVDTVGNMAKTAAKKVANKIAGTTLDEALGTAGDVLDFLGPIGELGSLGLGIYSLIEGLKHKHPKEVVETNVQQQQQGAGLDATALKAPTPVVGTLV